MSVGIVLKRHGITHGCLGLDDSDKRRSKMTRQIHKVHKIKDKSTGGFFMGQSLVFLVLITPKITIPVGVAFYMPDPAMTAWYKQRARQKKQGISGKLCTKKPRKNKDYPTKPEIALQLMEKFKADHPSIKIKCIVADALYGTGAFLNQASALFGGIQVISQIRNNQNIHFRNKKQCVTAYFAKHPGVSGKIRIRGGKEITILVNSARLYVCSHKQKRYVIALKYEGEENYRYLVASDLTWRKLDIAQAYTFRWLMEVFVQDWKANEGWNQLTKHPRDEGSCHGLILSLLVDHCLLLHPDQLARLDNKLSAFTVGSLREKIKMECLLAFIRDLLDAQNPEEAFGRFEDTIKEQIRSLSDSKKHMVQRDMGATGSFACFEIQSGSLRAIPKNTGPYHGQCKNLIIELKDICHWDTLKRWKISCFAAAF